MFVRIAVGGWLLAVGRAWGNWVCFSYLVRGAVNWVRFAQWGHPGAPGPCPYGGWCGLRSSEIGFVSHFWSCAGPRGGNWVCFFILQNPEFRIQEAECFLPAAGLGLFRIFGRGRVGCGEIGFVSHFCWGELGLFCIFWHVGLWDWVRFASFGGAPGRQETRGAVIGFVSCKWGTAGWGRRGKLGSFRVFWTR